MMNRLVVAFVILALLFPAVGFAQEEEAVLAEFVVRPVGFVTLVLGSAVFLVTLPVSVVVGGTDNMAEVLVKRPYRFTFQRHMGEELMPCDDESEGP
jgi:hypothetical protein